MSKQAGIMSFFGSGAAPPKTKPKDKQPAASPKKEALPPVTPSPFKSDGVASTAGTPPSRPADFIKKKRKIISDSESEASDVTPATASGALAATDAPREEKEEEEEVPAVKKSPVKKKAKTTAASPKRAGKTANKGGKAKGKATTGIATLAADAAAFDPSEFATWKAGKPVPFAFMAAAFARIESIGSRLSMTAALTESLRSVIELTPEDALAATYLALNKLAPAHVGIELGMGEATIITSLVNATGSSKARIHELYDEEGDLGIVATTCRGKQKALFPPPPLTVRGVFKKYSGMAATEGAGSAQKKAGDVVSLLSAAQGDEARYIVRALQGKMRIGLAAQSVLTAVAHAFVLSQPPGVELATPDAASGRSVPSSLEEQLVMGDDLLKRAFGECPSFDVIIPLLLKGQLWNIAEHCTLTAGVPVQPMLANPSKGVGEIFTKFEGRAFTCEYKYDGERGQVHCGSDGTVSIFSRNSEDNTGKYPDITGDIMDIVKPGAGVTSFVLDTEVVAWDADEQTILPFQRLANRPRKNVDVSTLKTRVKLFAFDLLLLNGKSTCELPLRERRRLLFENFRDVDNRFTLAEDVETNDVEDVEEFLDRSIKDSCEGLMIKALDAPNARYEPGKRSLYWVKLKKDYIEGLGDSLDLVPIGAYIGRGKRKGVYGAYLCACYDPDSETYQSVCKIGTGFKDDMLTKLTEDLKPHIIEVDAANPPSYMNFTQHPNITPDVLFEPALVWEVKAADLSLSPVHRAAVGVIDHDRGVALRFPRFIRERPDKGPVDATASNRVAEMYERQASVVSGAGTGNKEFTGGDDYDPNE